MKWNWGTKLLFQIFPFCQSRHWQRKMSVTVHLTILINAPYARMKTATRGNCVGFPSVNKRWLQPCFKGGIKGYRWLEYSFLFQFQTHSIQRCIQLVREQSQFNLWLPWGNCSSWSCPHSNLGYNPWLLKVKIHWSEENSAAGYNDPKWQGQ